MHSPSTTWPSSCTNVPSRWGDLSQSWVCQSPTRCREYLLLVCFPSLTPCELTLFLHHLVLSQLAALREFFHSSHVLRIFLLFYHVPKSRSALRPHGGCGLGTVQVLAHAALSAGIIGAGRLLGELQASAPITLSKTAIFFSS